MRLKNGLFGQPSVDKASAESDKRAISSTEQQVELQIMRTWIQVLIWRMALHSNLLSLDSPEECLSFLYPMRFCGNLRRLFDVESPRNLRVHGFTVLQMLFEVIDTIADVMMAAISNNVHGAWLYVHDFYFVKDKLLSLELPCEVMMRDKLAKLEAMIMQWGHRHEALDHLEIQFHRDESPRTGKDEDVDVNEDVDVKEDVDAKELLDRVA